MTAMDENEPAQPNINALKGFGLAVDEPPLPDVTVEIAEAMESGRRPLLSGAVFEVPRRFLLARHADPDGVTGVGAVAWGVSWPSGRVSIDWNVPGQMMGGMYPDMGCLLA